MTLNFNAWAAGGSGPILRGTRATSLWRMIQRDPTAITIDRDGVMRPVQTVLLTYPRQGTQDTAAGGRTEMHMVYVYGVRDHPTLPDADLRAGDQFFNGQRQYVIEAVTPLIGFVEALATAVR